MIIVSPDRLNAARHRRRCAAVRLYARFMQLEPPAHPACVAWLARRVATHLANECGPLTSHAGLSGCERAGHLISLVAKAVAGAKRTARSFV